MALTMPAGVHHPVIVEAAFGALLSDSPLSWTWTDLTDLDRVKGAVAVRTGRRPGAQHTEPAEARLRVGNDDAEFSPLNASSTYWPNVRRNTPIRIRVHPDIVEAVPLVVDTFARTVANDFGTSDDGWDWTVVSTAADYDTTGSAATMSIPAVATERVAYLTDLDLPQADVTATVTAPDPTGAGLSLQIMLRHAGVHRYLLGAVIAVGGAVTAQIVRRDDTAADTILAATASGVTHAAATPLNIRAQAYDGTLKVRIWQGATEPTTWHATAADTTPLTGGTDGVGGHAGLYAYAATGNTNAKPFNVTWDSFTASTMPIRMGGFADDFELDWPAGDDSICETRITASGITRRLSRERPLRSTPVRWIPTTDPIAYWPMENGPLTEASAALVGTFPMRSWSGTHTTGTVVTTPQWGAGTLAPWLPQVLSRSAPVGLSIVYAPVAMPGFTTTWTVDFAYAGGSDAKITRVDINPVYLGGDVGWPQLSLDPANNRVLISMNSEPEVEFDAGDLFDGQSHHMRLKLSQSGANVAWQVYIDGNLNVGTTSGAMTLYAINRLAHVAEEQSGANVAVGHFAVWTTPPDVDEAVSALRGWRGETPSARFLRLLREENIPAIAWPATAAADSVLMGPQGVKTLLDLLRETETTDGGLLFEIPFGYGYLPRPYRYNRAATLTLDTAHGDVQIPFRPAYDDRDLTNDVEIRRDGGETVQGEATTGTLIPDEYTGRYRGSATVNTDTDEPLDNIRDWQLHVGTVDEYRVPVFRFSPADRPDLVEAWMATGVGSRFTATVDLPQYPGGVVDQQLDGYTETFDAGPVWQVDLSGSPASPYQVGVIEGDDTTTEPAFRLDTGGSELVVAVDDDDTTLRLATTSGREWTTTAAFPTDFPFDVNLDGEQVTVTAITTAAPAFVATGIAQHGNNVGLTPAIPAGMTVDAGQILLLWAAIRNSGTGIVNDVEDWTTLVNFGNVRLFGRYYNTGVAAPVVTYNGSAANVSTSAQLFGFSGTSLEVEFTATQLNASAQDIATPAGPTDRRSNRRVNRLLLWGGWKQDDWSSAAVVSGGLASEAGDTATTLGDDQGIVFDYYMQATPANVAAATIAITGGAAAISRSIVVALRPLQTFTVTRAVNGVAKTHAAGTSVALWKPPVIAL